MQWQQLGYGCETSPSQNLFYVVHRNYQAPGFTRDVTMTLIVVWKWVWESRLWQHKSLFFCSGG